MPRQNRVTPFGEIIATPERGMFLGNRGVLHDGAGRIKRGWQVKRWLVCVLEFRGRKREVMAPNRYTELFFLDEATALAAGHRPCAECRRGRFLDFCNAWKRAHPHSDGATADEIDRQLHIERVNDDRAKRTFTRELSDLTDGVFVTLEDSREQTYLVRGESLFPWSPGGYGKPRLRPRNAKVVVLTPASSVETIGAGYIPEIHPSAVCRSG